MTLHLQKIKVMIVADHPIMRDGLRLRVKQETDMDVVCETAEEALVASEFDRYRPDVTIIDLQHPRGAGPRSVRAIRGMSRQSPIIILTTYPWEAQRLRPDDGLVFRISKTASGDDIINAVRKALLFDSET